MRKTLLAMTLAVAVMSLVGCGSSSDNSDVLAEIASLREEMNGGFERVETKVDNIQPTVSQEQSTIEQSTETEETQEQSPAEVIQNETPAEQTTETEAIQAQAPSTGFQIFALHNGNTIPITFTEGSLKDTSGACVSKAINLNAEENKVLRDVTFVFIGEEILNVSWVNGNTYSGIDALLAEPMTNSVSSTAFNMSKAEGIYSFEVTLKSGKVYSFSIKYHYDNVI